MFVNELSSCGFEFCYSHLFYRYHSFYWVVTSRGALISICSENTQSYSHIENCHATISKKNHCICTLQSLNYCTSQKKAINTLTKHIFPQKRIKTWLYHDLFFGIYAKPQNIVFPVTYFYARNSKFHLRLDVSRTLWNI